MYFAPDVVDDVATSNLGFVHQSVNFLELAQADGLVRHGDEAPGEEVQGLGGVGAVADVAALDGDHADDGVEDGGAQLGAGGQADADQDSLGPQVLRGLLEGLLLGGDEQGGVGAVAVGGGGLDVGDEVLGLCEVDEGGGAELEAQVALLVAGVDGDGVQAHGAGVLEGDAAEAAAGADDGDGLAGPGLGLLQALVDGDAGAEDGGHGLEVALLGDAGDVGGLGYGVLLEGPVDGVAREEGLVAERLVAVLAVGAAEARAVEPLDAGVVANLNVRDERAAGDDDAGALVAADQGQLCVEGPVAHHGVKVRVADARVLDVDEDFIGAGLLDGDPLVDDG
ncbi:hypothetical protein Trco_006605 [Trichoderma cornu-damae]|uniref:Uncharacterized protein n=1 Tax=Trichoderma cornu-damae TaxID=654480 RepID=A0A9P8TU25_9HYPO|nr:hypothetical protein Trco_006605 [Trichoderma cornu-damae]